MDALEQTLIYCDQGLVGALIISSGGGGTLTIIMALA